VPQNDCAQIGVCLRRVLEDKDLARRLGEHARKRAVAYYSLDSAANQYAHVFRGFEE
jgi:glycosyltransferase involved in cell wall biosynthesis